MIAAAQARMKAFGILMRRFRGRRAPHNAHVALNPDYVAGFPCAQKQLDLFAGAWTSTVPVPGESTASGPRADLFNDERLGWALTQAGSIDGKRVLELGPLEGGHTFMLERAGAGEIVAIEALAPAFMRCLIVKNLLGLRARFLLGDFVEFLRETTEEFDLGIASGVLYHMLNPLELLQLVGARCKEAYVWTHYYDDTVLQRRPDVADRLSVTTELRHDGFTSQAWRYEYREGPAMQTFCGGLRKYAYWLPRADILEALRWYGYS
ncbi:MAG: class I SAM-dependent methyltransferase, partial [Actinomycetota bacterium]|nr:class I SAM-dependent methyltransferase [Actinomycetota bacterium]